MMVTEKRELRRIVKDIPKEDLKLKISKLYRKHCDISQYTYSTFRKYLYTFRGEKIKDFIDKGEK